MGLQTTPRLAAVLLGLAACARPAPLATDAPGSARRVDLQYGFRPGSTCAVHVEVEARMSASSGDPDAASAVADLDAATQILTLDLEHSFSEAADPSVLTMTTGVRDLRLDTTVGGAPRVLSDGLLDALRRLTLRAAVDRKGRRLSADVEGPLPEGWTADDLAGRLAPSLPTLPDAPLTIGASFTTEAEASLSPGPLVGETGAPMSVAATYTLRRVAGGQAVFDVTTALLPGEDAGPQAVRITGAEGSGTAVFDLDLGFFTQTGIRQTATLELQGPPAILLTLDLGLRTTAEIVP